MWIGNTNCNMKKTWFMAMPFLMLGLFSCQKENQTKEPQMEMLGQPINETYVDTTVLRMQPFNKQIVCNGRLRAKAKSELSFLQQGVTMQICVTEGQYVAKGTLIASLDKTERLRELEKAEHELERARVELTDKLIGLGYDATLEGVPEDVMKRAEVTSGYYSAKFQLQSVRTALAECDLYAPYAGRVASVMAEPYQRNDKICTLIDDSQFEVEFSILEAELPHVEKGMKVRMSPYIEDSLEYVGAVSEINPMIDDKGLTKVAATIRNDKKGLLVDGMNVRIVVEQQVQQMFVVPKDAVVERDGYHVVFLYENGKAVWTYVDVVYSNIGSYAISGCKRKETTLNEGDVIITSGNLNLADGTPVNAN